MRAGHTTHALKDGEVCYDVKIGHNRVAILELECTAGFPSGEKVSGAKAHGTNQDREAEAESSYNDQRSLIDQVQSESIQRFPGHGTTINFHVHCGI